ncbi:chorismate mutase I [Lachnospiraceae bacterium KM106-2]|nr:chorismate mutase I [Lachnospiraceae bacterium KM106-2]
MIDLRESRDKIDTIDRQIVKLFEDRMKVSNDVAEYKIATGKKVYDKQREDEKLAVLRGYATDEFNKHGIEELFTQIMSISRKLQYGKVANEGLELGFTEGQLHTDKQVRVAYFGEPGSYSEQAMIEVFGENIKAASSSTFQGVMELLKNHEVEYAVLPIENSSTGGIDDIYDLLVDYNHTIIGEHILKVEHALLAVDGATMDDIKTVYSHEQGLRQCKHFFDDRDVELIKCKSTSGAAKKIIEDGDRTQAAISSKRAATTYGLNILAEKINEEELNATRFIIITNQKIYLKDADIVSISFEAPHEKGTLYNMLSNVIYNSLNMTKIESRPMKGRRWEYRFFIEFEGNINMPAVKNALYGIREEATNFRLLGNMKTI